MAISFIAVHRYRSYDDHRRHPFRGWRSRCGGRRYVVCRSAMVALNGARALCEGGHCDHWRVVSSPATSVGWVEILRRPVSDTDGARIGTLRVLPLLRR